MLTWSRQRSADVAKPFCDCFADNSKSNSLEDIPGCKCGEHSKDIREWQWETSTNTESSWVKMTPDQTEVTFHPFYSSGTAVVRGSAPLEHGYHYYWEIKMLTEPYGTDIMVGIGTHKVDTTSSRYRFTSLLGQDKESYGLSYTGAVRHKEIVTRDGPGFCKGTVVGVKVDLWQGTLEFFLNRQSRGISFYNLRRHPSLTLFPMVSSTAAQSTMRLIYAGSWQASLLVDAAKILGTSFPGDLNLPPGLKSRMKNQFWMMLPNESCIAEERRKEALAVAESKRMQIKTACSNILLISGMKRKLWHKQTSKKTLRYCDVITRLYEDQ
ncbi:unnamed protein product [Arctia plantaginis]|uniref:B30.2/SPRY domain-containing protein n=1 Tax=Arctia plantaginis TaxID=874455 RepID=A0A8S1BGT0_ARCPL|nr:unnamed protein product [Arctia plantaginis]CAB3261824.1 unnamed protein product [Arctia plantaginis]